MTGKVTLTLTLTHEEAAGLSQLVKRAARRDLGQSGLNLVTAEEEAGAEAGLYQLREVLAQAGYDPR